MPVNATLLQQAEALIHEQVVNSIMQDTPKQSVVMQLGRRLPNMTSNMLSGEAMGISRLIGMRHVCQECTPM